VDTEAGSATPDGEIDLPSVGDHLRELIESEMLGAQEPGEDDAERAGYIKKIDMVNFMCHDNLTIEFGPRMNFITGKNGSGKSTILTALTTCLGGKASSTNRGSSVKSLIKEGKSRALIRVTIANKGSNSYDHNRFGDIIQVERRLDAEASGSYKIMNSGGKVVSSSKEELRKILSIFSIFVDNPFAILTQDTARSFLTESNAESKYQHFKRAMTMDKIENYKEGLSESLLQQKQKLASQKEIVNEIKAKAKDVEAKFQNFKKLDSADEDLRYWNAILEWNKVSETERKITHAESSIEKIQNDVEEIKSQCENHEGISAQKQAELDQVHTEMNQVNDTITKLQEEIKSIKEGNRSNIETMRSLKEEKAKIVDSKEQSKRQVVALEQEKAKLLDTSGFAAARRQKHEQLDRVKSQLEKLASESENDEQTKSSTGHKVQELEENLQSAQDKQRKAEASVQQERARLKELRESQTNSWSTYAEGGRDADFKGFMAHFEKTNFKDSPIGPIGRYVTLKDRDWSSVLEQTLKRATSNVHRLLSRRSRQVKVSSSTASTSKSCFIAISRFVFL
jgi:chromosome segregation ATPase